MKRKAKDLAIKLRVGRLWLAGLTALAVCGLVAVPAAAESDAPVISQAEIDEIDRDMARPRAEGHAATKEKSTLECGDDYCRGLYEDVIDYIWFRIDGQVAIAVHPDVIPFLGSSSHACARDWYMILGFSSESSATVREVSRQMAANLELARAMGHEVRIEWVQSNYSAAWMVCKVYRVLIYGPPTSGT